VRVDENLPQGNAGRLRIDAVGRVHFLARRAVRGLRGATPRSMWWGFRILGAAGRRVTCLWEHTEQVLGAATLGAVVPVVCEAGHTAHRRVPERTCRFLPNARRFEFVVPCRSDETWVYSCYPYGPADLAAFLRRLSGDPRMAVHTISQSAGGRPCRLIRLHDPDADPVSRHSRQRKRRRQVWLRARSHAGEVSGSYVLEGAILEALRRRALLRRADVCAVPFLDVDGVALGSYGKDRPPRDFNRDFCLRPRRPEVRAFLAAVARWSHGSVDYAFDLHAPAPGNASFLLAPHASLLTRADWAQHAAFARHLARRGPVSCPVPFERFSRDAGLSMDWAASLFEQTGTAFLWRRHGGLVFTVETAYHRNEDGRLVTPAGWRALGRALMATVADHLSGRVPALRRSPRRPRGRLGPWLLVNRLSDCRATCRGTTVTLTPSGPLARAVLATPVLAPADRVRWSLTGRASGRVFIREMAGQPPLPTGREAQAALELGTTRRWSSLPEPSGRTFRYRRILLEVTELDGALTLDLATD